MPKYFFHVMDGFASIDEDGTDLPNVETARIEAIRTAGEILASGEASGGMLSEAPWRMTVVDDSAKTVFTLSFQARKYF